MSRNIVIIGNGISGITAARNIRKSSSKDLITVISSESDYFFSRTALMYIYMGHMKFENTKPYEDWFWKKNKIDLVNNYVSKVDVNNNKLYFSTNETMDYDILILATGSIPNKFGWPGQDLNGVQGLFSLQDLEQMEENTKGINNAVIIGGGLIGVEMAEMLRSRNINVTLLAREKQFWDNVLPVQEAKLIGQHIKKHNVDLKLETELKEIIGDERGRVVEVITGKNEKIPCGFVGLTAGVSPNIEFLNQSGIETGRGILVDEYLRTNIENIYAIGDCAEHRHPPEGRKPIEQVWYTGRMMGSTVAKTITGKPIKYNPGVWFNSAKFFDIEYQTYGYVNNTLGNDENEFYWENGKGEKCMHFIFNRDTKIFKGVNSFGIRLQQDIMEQWLSEKRDIYYVIKNLKKANFDPEFFQSYETEIANSFNQQFPELNVEKAYDT